METFPNVVQATYRLVAGSDFYLKGNWASGFFKNNNPVVVELGCGKGEYTVGLAEQIPGINYIGVDIKGARMWKGAKQAIEKGLKNVAFLRANIENINHFFAPGEIAEIWLTFPDPQMKKTARRITSAGFLTRYRAILPKQGKIHLKTDSNFQFQYMLALAKANHLAISAQTENLYESDLVDEVLSIKTFYEKQWLDRGIPIKYLAFSFNHDEPLIEPGVYIERDLYRSFGRSARDI